MIKGEHGTIWCGLDVKSNQTDEHGLKDSETKPNQTQSTLWFGSILSQIKPFFHLSFFVLLWD